MHDIPTEIIEAEVEWDEGNVIHSITIIADVYGGICATVRVTVGRQQTDVEMWTEDGWIADGFTDEFYEATAAESAIAAFDVAVQAA